MRPSRVLVLSVTVGACGSAKEPVAGPDAGDPQSAPLVTSFGSERSLQALDDGEREQLCQEIRAELAKRTRLIDAAAYQRGYCLDYGDQLARRSKPYDTALCASVTSDCVADPRPIDDRIYALCRFRDARDCSTWPTVRELLACVVDARARALPYWIGNGARTCAEAAAAPEPDFPATPASCEDLQAKCASVY